jgi:hypothetical protein
MTSLKKYGVLRAGTPDAARIFVFASDSKPNSLNTTELPPMPEPCRLVSYHEDAGPGRKAVPHA